MPRIPFLAMQLCICCLFAAAFLTPAIGRAAGGTSIVATEGHPAYVAPSWPEGVGEIVNDAARTKGWNSWFSEWPNDVNQYAFEIKSADDLNRLIEKLAAVKTIAPRIHFSPMKEPRGLGWVTQLPEGNNTPVIFSIGDQSRIDEWYKHVRKPFGKIEFLDVPVAVAPTLTIYVQNEAIDLDKLVIPKEVSVARGEVPAIFHRWNTTKEKALELTEEQKQKLQQAADEQLDPPARQAVKQIEEFLKKRAERAAVN